MEKHNLDNNDYKIIRDLLKISSKIKNHYDILTKLEENGKKGSSEYTFVYNRLIANKKIENEIYNLLGNNILRIQAIMEHFYELSEINNLIVDLKVLVDGTKDDFVKRRIIIKLLKIKMNERINELDEMAKELDADLNFHNIKVSKIKNYAYYGLKDLLDLSSKLKVDFINSFLCLLNREKSNFTTESRYDCNFLFDAFEDDLVDESSEQLYWQGELFADLKFVPSDRYKESLKIFGSELVQRIEKEKMNSSNKEKWDFVLRVALLFCDSEEIKYIKECYEIKEEIFTKHIKDKESTFVPSLKKKD